MNEKKNNKKKFEKLLKKAFNSYTMVQLDDKDCKELLNILKNSYTEKDLKEAWNCGQNNVSYENTIKIIEENKK